MSLKSRLDNPVFGPLFNALLRFTNDIIIDNGVVFLLTVCLISEEEFVDYLKTSEPHYVDFNEVSLAFLVSDLFTHLVQTEYASYVDDQRILPNDPMQEIAAQIGWEPQPLNPLYSEEAMKFVQSNKELHKFFVERIRLNFNLPKKKVIDLTDVNLGPAKIKLVEFCKELIGEENVDRGLDQIRSATTAQDVANNLILLLLIN